MKRFFISGTDTDCGKTYVLCQLLEFLHRNHKTALGLKPVASGCVVQPGELINEDLQQIKKVNGTALEIGRWKYLPPISPHLAAEQVGEMLSTQAIASFCNESAFVPYEYLLIEGAGGIMAPLNPDETWLDFVGIANLSVIIVVGMRLGCLNHALLTASVLKSRGIDRVGWIANCLDPNMLALEENITTLKKRISFPHLATIDYQGGLALEDTSRLISLLG